MVSCGTCAPSGRAQRQLAEHSVNLATQAGPSTTGAPLNKRCRDAILEVCTACAHTPGLYGHVCAALQRHVTVLHEAASGGLPATQVPCSLSGALRRWCIFFAA